MISTENNRIGYEGSFTTIDFRRLLATVHGLIVKKGYLDLEIDFSNCTSVDAGAVIALCTQIRKYRYQDVDFNFVLPKKKVLNRLFINTNWAHIIDPVTHEQSSFRGLRQVPATQFFTFEEKHLLGVRLLKMKSILIKLLL